MLRHDFRVTWVVLLLQRRREARDEPQASGGEAQQPDQSQHAEKVTKTFTVPDDVHTTNMLSGIKTKYL